ncbi:MAG TPA: hypothetical protein VKB52_01400 [Rhodanobacteraceae bacterium]|nr:hypothetical protein [Rhodanobacteraceae bacterium]
MFRWHFHRTRHPLARLFGLVIGAIALVVLLAFGLVAAAALVVGGAIVVLIKALTAPQPPAAPVRPAAAGGVIEGEFKVVSEPQGRRPSAG